MLFKILNKYKIIIMQNRGRKVTNNNKTKLEIKYEESEKEEEKKVQDSGKESEVFVGKKKENKGIKKRSQSVKKLYVKPKFEEESYQDNEKNNIKEHKLSKSQKPKNTQNLEQRKPPKDYEKIWEIIKSMREAKKAPNDQMDEEYAYFFDPKRVERKTHKFQMLVFALLSSLTKGKINLAASMRLVNHGLTVDNIIKTDEEKIKELIRGCAFLNNKAKFLKKLATILKEKYNSDPPEDLQEVLKLPGIGPKMAYVYLELGCKKREGMIVDTHVHRITNRLKWVNDTKTPEETRKELESWLPKDRWVDLNLMLVAFGQTICIAPVPKCQECKLNKICGYGIERLKESNHTTSKSKSKSKKKGEKISPKDEEEEIAIETTSKIKRKTDDKKHAKKKAKK
jgi:endonuclease III